MLDDSTYSTSHGAIGVQMAVNLETNFRFSESTTTENKYFQQLKVCRE
jgi:hypothetical protein